MVGSSFDELGKAADALVAKMEQNPGFGQVRLGYQTTQPQLFINVDRERASDLGIDIDGLGETLQAVLDGTPVGSVFVDDRSYDIKLVSTTNPVRDPLDLENLFLKTRSGDMVPMSTVVTLEERPIAPELDREGQMRSVAITAGLDGGMALGEAYARGREARASRCCRRARGSSRSPTPRRSARPRTGSSSPSASRSSSSSWCWRRSSRASSPR